MPALVITGVDMALLEEQRKVLNEKFDSLCQAGASKEALEALQGLLAMLDHWSDQHYYQTADGFDPGATWTPEEALEAIVANRDPDTALWSTVLSNCEMGEYGWAAELLELWGSADLPELVDQNSQ